MTNLPPNRLPDDPVARTWERLDHLGTLSDDPHGLTRVFLGPGMQKASTTLQAWMRTAGLAVQGDAWGNLFGRTGQRPGLPLLVIGSHLDTVRQAGKYDGALGILVGLAALETIGAKHWPELPFDIELASFSDEEGVRFQTTYLGSRAALGLITDSDLARSNAAGELLASLIPPEAHRPSPRYQPGRLLAYWEVHIEQGPILETKDLALGVVTGIAGQTRAKLSWHGHAAHAGTCPMNLRHDALTGAAAFILAAEQLGRTTSGLVVTVGCLDIPHAASNVVPALVHHTLDVRHLDSKVRQSALAHLQLQAQHEAAARGLQVSWETVQENEPVLCHPRQQQILAQAIATVQEPVPHLGSGAGHDAVIMAQAAPVGMIFVRCAQGISHHPDESVRPEDVRQAINALVQAIRLLAQELAPKLPRVESEVA